MHSGLAQDTCGRALACRTPHRARVPAGAGSERLKRSSRAHPLPTRRHHPHERRDVAEAQRQRKQLLLEQTVGVDRGKRPFELLASATAIQRESAGLGLYFHTLKYLLLIVGAACLLAIYPILDNIQADKTVEAYEFRTANVSAADTITRNCTREYDVRTSRPVDMRELWLRQARTRTRCGCARAGTMCA